MIIVSACLLGLNTKYDGKTNTCTMLQQYCTSGKFIPVCPEQLGGLPTPRSPMEIIEGSGQDVLLGRCVVREEQGEEVTSKFILGAEEVLKMVKMLSVTAAILKERSPSCGVNYIYNGSFSHRKIPGQGVLSALLREYNIPIFSEEELHEEMLRELTSDEHSEEAH